MNENHEGPSISKEKGRLSVENFRTGQVSYFEFLSAATSVRHKLQKK